MSFEAIAWAWGKTAGITASQKMILLSLADHHNVNTGVCTPSIGRIAKHCCCSRNTVIRALDHLEQQKIIKRIARYTNDGDQTSNQYTLEGVVPQRDYPSANLAPPPSANLAPKPSSSLNLLSEPQDVDQKLTPELIPTEFPDGLSTETWRAFRAERKRLKKPMSQEAEKRLLKKLSQMKIEGEDPEAVVDQSITSGWAGLFPVKVQNGKGSPKKDIADSWWDKYGQRHAEQGQ